MNKTGRSRADAAAEPHRKPHHLRPLAGSIYQFKFRATAIIMSAKSTPKRIAVVGSGVAGLSAAWLLAREPEKYSVTVYESGDYVGGHTHTVDFPALFPTTPGSIEKLPVDTGFIVCNPVTYPNYLALMRALDVPMSITDMSFSVSRNKGEFEWCGDNLSTVFSQRKNILPLGDNARGLWRMILDIVRFHNEAKRIAADADSLAFDDEGKVKSGTTQEEREHPMAKKTLAEFFNERSYSTFFYENYIVPMTAAIWSTPADMAFDKFPVLTLLRFMRNHQLLQIGKRPRWRTVTNGSREYVAKIQKVVNDIRVGTAITTLERLPDGSIALTDAKGGRVVYDHVILATHSDQALKILGENATPDERKILGAIKYVGGNRLVLHRDQKLMPRSRRAWAAWNYLTSTPATESEVKNPVVCLTYWMNRLQPFLQMDHAGPVFATLNPLYEPDPAKVLGSWTYEHPLYAPETIAAQEKLNDIQNVQGVTYAGAWTNYGFHEDGTTSGLLAALSLGASCPFPVHLNGGYVTERVPPPPAPWAVKQFKATRYVPAPPEHIRHTKEAVLEDQRSGNNSLEIVIFVACGIFALFCMWLATVLDLGSW
ncbi:hypothetical protein DFS34DRAFT_627557 [Phlyctochytrium arcticum]|nr:hypothetical protein DFS34DRAFT_627557 [Phlyctochytrium arcticum]